MDLPADVPDEWPRWQQQLASGSAINDHETVRLHRNGYGIPVALTISPIRDEAGTVTAASVIARDITDRKRLEQELTRQALHDPLTGLANRALLQDRVTHAVVRSARTGERWTLLFIDTALQPPVDLDGTKVAVHASIGIAHHGGLEDAGVMLRNADLAMYAAKRGGKGGFEVFAPAMQDAVIERVELEAALRHAFAAEEFRLHYQPIVVLESREVVAFEALLRWMHPERGPLGPDRFVPVLEESGLIIPVGDWILRAACAQATAWQEYTGRALSVSVNVSPRQLEDLEFVHRVGQALTAAALPASSLVLEITEGVMLTDTDQVMATLHAVTALGVRMAVDDFGTGYSSLRYLQSLPIDSVKIDQSFIAKIHDDPEQATLAQAIVKVGHTLHLAVVAEGIETAEQARYLEAIGCQYGQGYFFDKPRDPAAVQASLQPDPVKRVV